MASDTKYWDDNYVSWTFWVRQSKAWLKKKNSSVWQFFINFCDYHQQTTTSLEITIQNMLWLCFKGFQKFHQANEYLDFFALFDRDFDFCQGQVTIIMLTLAFITPGQSNHTMACLSLNVSILSSKVFRSWEQLHGYTSIKARKDPLSQRYVLKQVPMDAEFLVLSVWMWM